MTSPMTTRWSFICPMGKFVPRLAQPVIKLPRCSSMPHSHHSTAIQGAYSSN
ncbi:hypothetical protein M407DRAFT_246830 [Tulasnella calospora MUT 4182]|uniref:Uncharacterized protein n=1 Tax=Tulasnella calospora MUT 4182 TaxID=1051891 RepID=A0A0C3Q3F3_9AGAM|nr:hypothetical protein M407DRAFT_246830 [Tulasnella calospora MUT 4182]